MRSNATRVVRSWLSRWSFQPLPARYARTYLGQPAMLVLLLAANVGAMLVGVDYYVATMPQYSPLLWPLYVDSPVALLLVTLSLATMLPNLGRPLEAAPRNLPLAYLHTFAFVWLVKYGLWSVVALNLRFGVYAPVFWAYLVTLLPHVLFLAEAYLLPHYGATTPGALGAALVLALADTVADYGFGLHPPIRYEPGVVLPAVTAALSVLAVVAAALAFEPLESATHR